MFFLKAPLTSRRVFQLTGPGTRVFAGISLRSKVLKLGLRGHSSFVFVWWLILRPTAVFTNGHGGWRKGWGGLPKTEMSRTERESTKMLFVGAGRPPYASPSGRAGLSVLSGLSFQSSKSGAIRFLWAILPV